MLKIVLPKRRRRRSEPETERELATRRNGEFHVSLLWRPSVNGVSLAVEDVESGHRWKVPVDPRKALDAFYHPLAYVG